MACGTDLDLGNEKLTKKKLSETAVNMKEPNKVEKWFQKTPKKYFIIASYFLVPIAVIVERQIFGGLTSLSDWKDSGVLIAIVFFGSFGGFFLAKWSARNKK